MSSFKEKAKDYSLKSSEDMQRYPNPPYIPVNKVSMNRVRQQSGFLAMSSHNVSECGYDSGYESPIPSNQRKPAWPQDIM